MCNQWWILGLYHRAEFSWNLELIDAAAAAAAAAHRPVVPWQTIMAGSNTAVDQAFQFITFTVLPQPVAMAAFICWLTTFTRKSRTYFHEIRRRGIGRQLAAKFYKVRVRVSTLLWERAVCTLVPFCFNTVYTSWEQRTKSVFDSHWFTHDDRFSRLVTVWLSAQVSYAMLLDLQRFRYLKIAVKRWTSFVVT